MTCDAQVRARQLWGNEIYTQDSDLVAVLMHCGFYNHALSAPPPNALEVRAVVQPLPPQPFYNSCARNSIRSRGWGAAVGGCSYRVRLSCFTAFLKTDRDNLICQQRDMIITLKLTLNLAINVGNLLNTRG